MKSDEFLPPVVPKALADARRRLKAGLPAPPEVKRTRKRKVSTLAPSMLFTEAFDTLFREWFEPLSDFAAWRAAGAALFGEPMTDIERATFEECTSRTTPPTSPAPEAWYVVGRRGGKGWFIAAVAVFLACVRPPALKRGEQGMVMCLAVDKDQAGEVFRYIRELITSIPQFAAMIDGKPTKAHIDLTNRVRIVVQVSNWRRIRGRKLLAAICDEIAFWWNDETSTNPDKAILQALRPSMLGTSGAMLLAISSPYAQAGEMWNEHRRHYGKDGDPIEIWQAPTWTMHPSVDQAFLDREKERDPVAFDSEYGANFRTDLASYISAAAVDPLVVPGRTVLPWYDGKSYRAFLDAAGGGGKDSLALGIAAHDVETGKTQLVTLLEVRPPFSATAVAETVAGTLKAYGLTKVEGDRFSGATWQDLMRANGIEYQFTERNKSDLYHDVLPLLTGQKVELLDNPRMIAQLLSLERRTGSSGRDIINHPPRGNDDAVNAMAGALVIAHEASVRPSGFAVASFTKSYSVERHSPTPTRYGDDARWQHPHERDVERPMRSNLSDAKRAAWLNNAQRPGQ